MVRKRLFNVVENIDSKSHKKDVIAVRNIIDLKSKINFSSSIMYDI